MVIFLSVFNEPTIKLHWNPRQKTYQASNLGLGCAGLLAHSRGATLYLDAYKTEFDTHTCRRQPPFARGTRSLSL
jgi:hypothetical protein